MADAFKRTLTYRRAQWGAHGAGSGPPDLARYVSAFVHDRVAAGDRQIESPDGRISILNRCDPAPALNGRPGFYGEFISFSPDKAAEIAPLDLLHQPSVDIESLRLEKGKSFVDGRLFFLAYQRDIILAPHALVRETSFTNYLNEALRPSHLPEGSWFILRKVARTDKIRAVQTEGVREVDLKMGLYNETLQLVDPSRSRWSSEIKNLLRSVVQTEASRSGVLQQADLEVDLALKLRGRIEPVEAQALGRIAQEVIETEEEYYEIVLKNKVRIRPNEMIHSRPALITGRHGRIDHTSAWQAMYQYAYDLSDIGALD